MDVPFNRTKVGRGQIRCILIPGIHAREWIAPVTAFYLIDSLIDAFQQKKDPRITNVSYYIMPILNPDGYEYSR